MFSLYLKTFRDTESSSAKRRERAVCENLNILVHNGLPDMCGSMHKAG